MNPTPMDAVTWYRDELTYEAFKKACADPEQFPPTYAEWLRRAEEGTKEAQRQGVVLRKAHYTVEEFLAWCKVHSKRADRMARSQFACVKMMKEHKRRN
jgi:hypothetical protein